MVKADDHRLAALQGYTATRRYRLVNHRFHKQGEMTVSMVCSRAGVKTFKVLSESGSGIVRSRVLRKMIEAEAEASQQSGREQHRILPRNYDFRLIGMGTSAGRPSYVLEIAPKTRNKFLIRGRIWVDAEQYAITRFEGSPAKNPSFWTRSIQVVHHYGRAGPFWLPVSNVSHAEARIFGRTDVTIDYFDYLVNGQYRTDARDASIDPGGSKESTQ